jgi:osmoprotectant transport system ATP-binding protein
VIEFQAVTKRYPDGTMAVDALDLVIERGSITVLVGPNGCGKTTCLRMINRMVDPTSGRILLDGEDVQRSRPERLRRGIGYVIQHAGLFPHRTVLDNVTTVPLLLGADRGQAETRAVELLDLVGLPAGLANRYPAQLSGGQRQRVGVARALAADPPVLLMDEPFSSVDPIVRVDLQQQLLSLQSELGRTIVFVTHDIDEAIRLGDKVAVFRTGGVLAQYDSPAAVLANPADDFVSSFVGRDRGYRALGLVAARGIRLAPLACVAATELASAARARLAGGWAVVVDERRHPLGWVSDGLLSTVEDRPLSEVDLIAGGSLFRVDPAAGETAETLQNALDAALSSPSQVGVAVDADGAVVGGISADTVLATLAATRGAGEIQD